MKLTDLQAEGRIDLLELTGQDDTRHLPRAAHDGIGCTLPASFAALVGKPGETVEPEEYVFHWVGIARRLGVKTRTVRRQLATGSLAWVPTVNGLPSAHVSSLANYVDILDAARLDQRRANLPNCKGTLFKVVRPPKKKSP